MPEVSGRALVVAIQAVHKEMRELQAYIASGDEEGQADTQELLLTVEDAARELKTAYEHALRMSSNLPSYERLTRDKT
jgi:hypothetical protein